MIIVWFRRDLRLDDNPALAWAAAQGSEILPVFIHAPDEETPWAPGAASRWWLHNSLLELEKRLAARGLKLHCYRANAIDLLPALARSANASAVAANRLYDPHLAQRDDRVGKQLVRLGIDTRFFDAGLLFAPGTLLNRQDQPYRVFTPFWRSARSRLETALPDAAPALPRGRLRGHELDSSAGGNVASLGLPDANVWHDKLHRHWRPGETAARRQLNRFIASGLCSYQADREIPSLKGSSRLSPHLHFGEITAAQVCRALAPRLLQPEAASSASVERYLAELGWREFAHHVLWHFPDSSQHSMNPRFADAFWTSDDGALHAWQHGRTGIALVDAGMRELWQTGWMHNRVRMLVGSFLTKNLGIHWLSGARWFWDTLVDADLASNSLGWQWVAGCGVDAAPYYRIFNPETQAQKFDPQRVYINKWLRHAPKHEPIVDLAGSRERALARYRELQQNKG